MDKYIVFNHAADEKIYVLENNNKHYRWFATVATIQNAERLVALLNGPA